MERADGQADERVGAQVVPVHVPHRQPAGEAHLRGGQRQDHQGDHREQR